MKQGSQAENKIRIRKRKRWRRFFTPKRVLGAGIIIVNICLITGLIWYTNKEADPTSGCEELNMISQTHARINGAIENLIIDEEEREILKIMDAQLQQYSRRADFCESKEARENARLEIQLVNKKLESHEN
ncbi:MAG: hypothetical protein AAF206_07495 [Bacteroidota bacterium]